MIQPLAEILGRVLLILFYVLLASNLWQDLQLHFRLSSALLLLLELLVIALVVFRRDTLTISTSPREWGVAFFCTGASLLFRASGDETYSVATLMSILGAVVIIWGLASLRRSFGIVPANRGVRTGGIYRFVRHPLYAGYTISYLGFFINNLSLYNAVILIAWFTAQTVRLRMEEAHLASDPQYQAFMQTTRWRLIPGIW